MDGVIFDSERLYVDCCSEAAEGLGMEGIVETTLRCIGVRADVTDQILLDAYGDRALIPSFWRNTGRGCWPSSPGCGSCWLI